MIGNGIKIQILGKKLKRKAYTHQHINKNPIFFDNNKSV